MTKFTRCNKKYFQDAKGLYMVCTALNKDGKYRWEIHTSDGNGVYVWFNEFAHGVYWEDFLGDAINEAIEVLKVKFPNVTEVNYTAPVFVLANQKEMRKISGFFRATPKYIRLEVRDAVSHNLWNHTDCLL